MRQLSIGVFAVLVLANALLAPPAMSATSSATPPQGAPGTQFVFQADGFAANEQVSFWATQPGGLTIGNNAFRVRADANGGATWRWTAPTDAVAGGWEMVGFGNTSRIGVQIPFTVTSVATAPTPTVTLAVQPDEAVLGTTFVFSTTGFLASEPIIFWASSPNGATVSEGVTRVDADTNGQATWRWSPPATGANATPGVWLLVATGNTSGRTATVRFTATPPSVTLTNAVQPAAGGPGTTFSFTAAGFAADERVSFWVAQPDKQIIGNAGYQADVGADGRVTWAWTAPEDAVVGTWEMVVVGQDSRRSQQIRFNVTGR